MGTKIKSLSVLLLAMTLIVVWMSLPDRPHPELGAISRKTLYESRSAVEEYLGEAKSRLFGMTDDPLAQRHLILGGAPLEIGAAFSTDAWVYLNHPRLNGHPQWELALSDLQSLEEVTADSVPHRFHGMGDTNGSSAFGSNWKGHAVLVPRQRVIFIRAMTNQSTTYAVEVSKGNLQGVGRSHVEVRHLTIVR